MGRFGKGLRWPRAWVAAIALVLAGCGGAEDFAAENTGEEEDALAGSEKASYGIGEAYPDVALYEGPATPKKMIFDTFVAYLHASSTRIILESSAASDPAKMATALQWVRDVRTAGMDPYVTITAPHGYDVHRYMNEVGDIYRALAGHATHFGSINEPDLNGFSPEEAADYWAYAFLGLRRVCGRKCFVVAGEFAMVNAGSRYVRRYISRIHKHVHANHHLRPPRFWSMHDYADVVEGTTSHAQDYADLLTNSPYSNALIWITECGALLKHGGTAPGVPTHLSGNADAQEKAGRAFLNLGKKVRGVTRVLYYEIEALGSTQNTWDSALIDWNGALRPVACAILSIPSTCPGSLKGAGL
jgi:hypothetical protein